MNNDIWRAVGLIGDDLISAADEHHVKEFFRKKRRELWLKYASIAACFVIVIGGGVAAPSVIEKVQNTKKEVGGPYDAMFEIIYTGGKLIFLRVETTPCVLMEMSDPDNTVKVFENRRDIVLALYSAMNGKEAIDEVEFTAKYKLLLSDQAEEGLWQYLLEIGIDGTVRIYYNGKLLCYIQISEQELQSILQTLD